MMKRTLACLLAAIVAAPLGAAAATLSTLIADTSIAFDGIPTGMSAESESSAVATLGPSTGPRGQSGVTSAVARHSGLAASAVSDVMGGNGVGPARTFSAASQARIRAFDLVLTNPTNPAATTTTVSLSFLLEGFLAIGGANNDGRSVVSSTLTVDYGLGKPGPGSTAPPAQIGRLRLSTFPNGFEDSVSDGTGIFDGVEYASSTLISDVFTTPTFTVPLDTELSFQLALMASAGGTSHSGDALEAVADFGAPRSLRFTSEAFFNLPAGVTAHSASLGLVDNAVTAAPVPIPAALFLFGPGLCLLSILGARRAGD